MTTYCLCVRVLGDDSVATIERVNRNIYLRIKNMLEEEPLEKAFKLYEQIFFTILGKGSEEEDRANCLLLLSC